MVDLVKRLSLNTQIQINDKPMRILQILRDFQKPHWDLSPPKTIDRFVESQLDILDESFPPYQGEGQKAILVVFEFQI